MGIVVTIFMLLGLLQLPPLVNLSSNKFTKIRINTIWLGYGLLLLGAWNALWHGLRNLDNFWGLAGLASGLFMMLTAILIWSHSDSLSGTNSIIISLKKIFKPISIFIFLGLLVSFLLYSTTLIRLNLDLPILS